MDGKLAKICFQMPNFGQNLYTMFTQGQWIFAGLFLLAFIIACIYVYRKDAMLHQKFYKGSYRVLIGFLVFIALLFVIKFTMKR